MATRSAIGVVLATGQIQAIYCHWDGYPEGVGRTLVNHYTNPIKIDGLINLGDLSVLGSEIGEKHPFDQRFDDSDPRANWCRAYGRDRGEEETNSKPFANREEFVSMMERSGCEYFYLWTNGAWHVSEGLEWSALVFEETVA